MSLCKSCDQSLTVEIEHDEEDESSMQSTETIPDDVGLLCGDHFHWQCLIDSIYDLEKCPACSNDITRSSSSASSNPEIPVSLNNEGGAQQNVDLFPVLQEECYLKTYPEERKARAFLEFCREGDHQAAVGVLLDDDEDEEEDGEQRGVERKLDAHAILRYQDPLAGEQSALHAAAANGHREIAWLLLLLASNYPELEFPPLVYQEAASLGVMREDISGKTDIRSLRDAQGRSAEDVARESGDVIWTGWIGNSRLTA